MKTLTALEALSRWSDLKITVNREALDNKTLHDEIHSLLAVLRPAVVAGEISIEAL